MCTPSTCKDSFSSLTITGVRPVVLLMLLALVFWLYTFVKAELAEAGAPIADKNATVIETNPLHEHAAENSASTSVDRDHLGHKKDQGVGMQMMSLKQAKSLSGGTDVHHFDDSSAQKQAKIEDIKDRALQALQNQSLSQLSSVSRMSNLTLMLIKLYMVIAMLMKGQVQLS